MLAQGGAQFRQARLVVEPGHHLGEGQRGFLARRVVVDVLPDYEAVEPLAGLAILAGFAGVHLDAVRAAVDLRGAQYHQVVEHAVEAERVDGGIDLREGLHDTGGQLRVADGVVVFHGGIPWIRRGALSV
ncbi:MAG: hypothetical protein L0H23_02505 [Luteimonas sp.]|nr:hypothetical protein [Luteimonas sp.]